MKQLKIAWLIAIAFSLIFASCKKESEDTLPPATQTGAGTFGCKINGKVYVTKGSSGTGTPNPKIQYDFDLNGQPYLSIETKRFDANIVDGAVLIYFSNLINTGNYGIGGDFKYSVGWNSYIPGCGVGNLDPNVTALGGGTISKLDIPNRIISGTFSFKAVKPNCDTIRITEGRFDIKF